MKYFSLIIVILLFTACTRSKYILDINQVLVNDLLDNINKNHNSLITLKGKARVTIESEELSGNFFADINCNKNDSLLLSIKGPFGIQAGKVFIGENRFIIYNAITNKFYNGSKDDFKNRYFLQFPLKISELIPIFKGADIISSMKIIEYTIKDGMFFIVTQNNSNVYNIWINHKNGHIYKLEYYRDNVLQYIKEYGLFIKKGKMYFPKRISIIRPHKKQAISIYYINLQLNKYIKPDKFVIDIADDAEQIDLSLEEMK